MINGQKLTKILKAGKLKIGALIMEYNLNKKLVNGFIITKFRDDEFFDAWVLISTSKNEMNLTGVFVEYFQFLNSFQYKVIGK